MREQDREALAKIPFVNCKLICGSRKQGCVEAGEEAWQLHHIQSPSSGDSVKPLTAGIRVVPKALQKCRFDGTTFLERCMGERYQHPLRSGNALDRLITLGWVQENRVNQRDIPILVLPLLPAQPSLPALTL